MRGGDWDSQYRTKETILSSKLRKGGNSPGTWFLKGEVTNTVTCSATPDSGLKQAISKSLASEKQADRGQTLVLEDGGLPIMIGLKVRDPFRCQGCMFKDDKCMINLNTDCSRHASV